MTLEDALTEFVATHNLAPQQLELAQRLVWVEEIGVSEHYDRSEMHDYMMEHYDRLFGPLRRPKSKAVLPGPQLHQRRSLTEVERLHLVMSTHRWRRVEYTLG